MENRTLTQYLSNFREAMLRLSINDYQKRRGFLKGLVMEFGKEVMPRQPQTFKEAVKYAQMYDNLLEKDCKGKSAITEPSETTTSKGKSKLSKNKFVKAKKFKLSPAELEKAKKKKIVL
ncbi:hypothetical protein O6H91_23G059000 [Diphasiastrum complanatum]|uniref:Uncharacterized protein n=1 Tax=Diphasiastrum complanatum TaxID=34168 RepID=A0ACC2AB23_DIPCM|nr:hypothetical protein O6H91_23G059000 [Diphasiastrum complanatum]